jgi:two-component system, chemotaxis family, protein-glutamate methylesterase/glutaminase
MSTDRPDPNVQTGRPTDQWSAEQQSGQPQQVSLMTVPPRSWLVVVGASAGGVEAVRDLVGSLGSDFPAALLIVIHTAPTGPNFLTEILERASVLPVSAARDGEPLLPGRIYVAVPDRHLLVDDGEVAVKRGPRENRYRPSVDALFRSAAYTHGHAVIGVVLSGMLDDGTSGLWTIKRLGGVSVVQTPSDALYDSMPRSALDNVEIDYVLPATSIGPLLTRLVQMPPTPHEVSMNDPAPNEPPMSELERRRLEVEVKAAAEGNAFDLGLMNLGELSPLTCPECHGVLLRVEEGRLTRFRCHTGHAYTASSLMDSVADSVESNLYQALRSLEEAVVLFQQMEGHQRGLGDAGAAQAFREKAQRAKLFAQQVQALSSRSLIARTEEPHSSGS